MERGEYSRQVPPDDWLQDVTPLRLLAEQAEAAREPGAEPWPAGHDEHDVAPVLSE